MWVGPPAPLPGAPLGQGEKLPDERFMQLSDICSVLSSLSQWEQQEKKLSDGDHAVLTFPSTCFCPFRLLTPSDQLCQGLTTPSSNNEVLFLTGKISLSGSCNYFVTH